MNLFLKTPHVPVLLLKQQQNVCLNVLNIDIARSSTSKGETLARYALEPEAMAADIFVVRHSSSGCCTFHAKDVCPKVAIINAGDGRHAHPTQAMLDMLDYSP